MAVAVWDGGAANNRWASADNWVNDVAPSPGDDLWFTGGALRKTNFNNFAPGTDFGSINFAAGAFTLLGNALELTGDITTLNASGDNTINLPITFTGAGRSRAPMLTPISPYKERSAWAAC